MATADPSRRLVSRNDLNKGDEVDIVYHIADGVPPRRVRGRVKDVMRAAARVTGCSDGKAERVVRFNQLERVGSVPTQVPRLKRAAESASAPLTSPPLREEADPEGAFEAWLEMGRELVEPVERELMEMADRAAELEDEKRAIEAELDAIAQRRVEMLGRVKRFKALIGSLK